MKTFDFKFAAAGTFVASLAFGAMAVTLVTPSNDSLDVTEHRGAQASWASNAETVAEQVQEADLVVRVQALGQEATRGFQQPVPVGAETTRVLFTDTHVEVLEVYQGKAAVGDRLTVMQTGGEEVLQNGILSRSELHDDPLYLSGDEMVLFLVDISGDAVHAPKRQLYRTVNPHGRYQVDGGLTAQPFVESHGADKGILHAASLSDLEEKIGAAVRDRQAVLGQ